jgi:hypothetical protein
MKTFIFLTLFGLAVMSVLVIYEIHRDAEMTIEGSRGAFEALQRK